MAGGYYDAPVKHHKEIRSVLSIQAEFDKIYDEGWEARISDAKKKDCPYSGKKKEVWMNGYEDAGVNFGRGYVESKSKASQVLEMLKD
jgi:ribosome modulation factor